MSEALSGAFRQARISRRDFMGTTAAVLCLARGRSATGTAGEPQTIPPELSAAVQVHDGEVRQLWAYV